MEYIAANLIRLNTPGTRRGADRSATPDALRGFLSHPEHTKLKIVVRYVRCSPLMNDIQFEIEFNYNAYTVIVECPLSAKTKYA